MSRYRRSRAAGGTFFFTVALADRKSSVLVEHVAGLRSAYRSVSQNCPFETLAICILPDHLHALWRLPVGDADFSSRWSRIKGGFSLKLPPAPRSASKLAKREKGIWQRRFWEHQIVDDEDLQRHFDYIHFNPVKHGLVQCVADWPYSSFHRCVRSGLLVPDWAGGAEDCAGYGEPE